MENYHLNYRNIPGWGMDNDPQDEPNYPMKHYTGDDHKRSNWERPTLQPVKTEILKSVERPYMTAAFGTTVPPSGLSGALRRYAYTHTESEYGRWLNLLLADRINVVEGFVADLSRGHLPNIFAERGMKADWQHNRKELVTKVIVAACVTTAICIFFAGRKKKGRVTPSPTFSSRAL